MKKIISLLTAAVLLVCTFTGCGGSEGGTVSTDGSTSMEKVIYLTENFNGDLFIMERGSSLKRDCIITDNIR